MQRSLNRRKLVVAALTITALFAVSAALAYVTAPPRSVDGYRERAAATAEMLRSQVETALLWSETYEHDKATSPATLVGLEEAEEDARAAAVMFEGFEPPSGTTGLRAAFVSLAVEVGEALSGVRIAAEQERWREVSALSAPLPALSVKLKRFEERAEP